jgi:LysM domain-containing protein
MTERGLPIVDGAPACPFVAFEDDRDERAASPDHRHRCYAEARPAPRALAHQEAYCLSPAFPVCPTFQDWARREAARSRADPPRPAEPSAAEAAAAAAQRNPPRNWAAPPPWASRGGRGDPSAADWDEDDPEGPALPPLGRGLSGSYADRAAAQRHGAGPDDVDDDDDASRLGLGGAGAAAAAGAAAGASPGSPPPPSRAPEMWNEEPDIGGPEVPLMRQRRERDPGRVAAFSDDAEARGPGPERRPERRRDEAAPEWERVKPMEAYPTLRSRRLPELSVSPIVLAVVALALAAAFVFALPGLLGFGNPQSAASPGASTPLHTALPSIAATPVPQPTQQIYIVQPNDTMSRIAGRFKIPLADLIAANAENLPNPDKLQIGDRLIIPVPVASQLPVPSQLPAAS